MTETMERIEAPEADPGALALTEDELAMLEEVPDEREVVLTHRTGRRIRFKLRAFENIKQHYDMWAEIRSRQKKPLPVPLPPTAAGEKRTFTPTDTEIVTAVHMAYLVAEPKFSVIKALMFVHRNSFLADALGDRMVELLGLNVVTEKKDGETSQTLAGVAEAREALRGDGFPAEDAGGVPEAPAVPAQTPAA